MVGALAGLVFREVGVLAVVRFWWCLAGWCGFDAVGCWAVLRCLNCVVWL